MAKLSNEAKTGLAVLASILILVGVLFKTGDLAVSHKGYAVKTRFADASGIKRFAPVCLSGIEVGEVREIVFKHEENQTWVELELWLESQAQIRDDSEAAISTMGLMGEKYVEIKSGQSAAFIRPGGVVPSREPVDLSRLIEKFAGVADEAKLALVDFRTMSQHLDQILVDAQPKLSGILTNVDGILEINRPKVDHILTNLEETSEYFKEFSEDIKYHPWKVLAKGKEKTEQELETLRAQRASKKATKGDADPLQAAAPVAAPQAVSTKKSAEKNKGFVLFGR